MQQWKYTFSLDDGSRHEFDVAINNETMTLEPVYNGTPAAWAALDFHKCANCPLDSAKTPFCPIAANMAGLLEGFKTVPSSATAQVVVASEERTVSRHTPLAEGLYSLLGICMSASGCPHMDRLKPMALYHLPFSTIEETVYRVMTMYITGQYFRMKKGQKPDWELTGLAAMYAAIREVNHGFAERIRAAAEKDCVINSLVNLDVFALVLADVPENSDGVARMFTPYLDK